MSAAARSQRAAEVVRGWVEETIGWGREQVNMHPAPQLSTRRFDLVVLAQAGVRGGGDLYVMTDGERVLPAGAANLGLILAEEGLAADPSAIAPELVAELFFRMAEVGRGRPIVDADDRALASLPAALRADFAAPHAARDGDCVRLRFWSERGHGGDIERWSVRVDPGGALEHECERVSEARD